MMYEVFSIISLLSLTLLTGNEFSIAAFIYPSLGKLPAEAQIRSVQSLSKTFGNVMPFWMGATLLLMLLNVFLSNNLKAWQFGVAVFAIALFAFVIVFSIIFPVPINNRIIAWNATAPPSNWREERRNWDFYHKIRVFALIASTISFILATA